MSEFPLSLEEIQDQNMVDTIVQIFLQRAFEGTVIKKDAIKKFFDSLLNNLENKIISPKTKFYSIFLLKQISLKQKVNVKIFGTFVNHLLYQHLENLALTVDPKKNLSQKGKNLFAADKNTGNQMMRIILESFVVWNQKFPMNSKQQPTKFKKTYNQLVQQKVVLPKDYIYYPMTKKQTVKNVSKKEEKKSQNNEQMQVQKPKPKGQQKAETVASKAKDSKQKYMVQLKYIQNKIQQLLGIIEDGQQQEEIRRQIKSFHNKFQKDSEKLKQYQAFIFQFNSQELANKYININMFLQQEESIYNKHVIKDDFASYLIQYKMIFQKSFEVSQIRNKKTPEPTKNQVSIVKKMNEKNDRTNQLQKKQLDIVSKQSITKQQNTSNSYLNNLSKNNEDKIKMEANKQNKSISQSFFVKRSKSSKVATQGFNFISKSLEKSKLNTVVSRMKSHLPPNSQIHKTKLLNGSTLNKSGFNLKGIFAHPPNPNVRGKDYQGQLVVQNIQLQKQCQSVTKKQGLRRFKTSFFKNKNIIFEDQFIQIGFKSSCVYEQVEKFSSFLDFQIFFGNKCSNNITKFQIFFKGDKKSVIYTNPQRVDHIIKPEQQVKLQLLSVPKTVPYSFISMAASYQILGNSYNLVALLPTSILQMTAYFEIDMKLFERKWEQCEHIFKTQPFKLSRHFPPDQLTHFLPKLKQKVPYIIFAEPGSTTDYQLACEIVIQQSFKSILKIIVRPDLSVVLQIGAYENQQNGNKYFKFYLQSLMVALKQINGI